MDLDRISLSPEELPDFRIIRLHVAMERIEKVVVLLTASIANIPLAFDNLSRVVSHRECLRGDIRTFEVKRVSPYQSTKPRYHLPLVLSLTHTGMPSYKHRKARQVNNGVRKQSYTPRHAKSMVRPGC